MLRSRPLAGVGLFEVEGSCFKLLVVASLGLVQKCYSEELTHLVRKSNPQNAANIRPFAICQTR